MKRRYFIFYYEKQGNIGNWHFDKVTQPDDGFFTEFEAIKYLEKKKANKDEYDFYDFREYAIIPIFTFKSQNNKPE